MAYSTATQVKDKDLSRLITQAGWIDSDVEERIAEGDAVIDSSLAGMGYDLDSIDATVPLVNKLSILYGRYACHRDIYQNFAPSKSSADGFEHFKKQFDDLIAELAGCKKGCPRRDLVDASGDIIERPNDPSTRVQISSDNVRRALDMGDPESQSVDAEYNDDDLIANP